eukprot:TRINITY_DN21019_c0_g1_i1.p1 TRINITY_DN21019_c0_g1~~TRINITY_DN21019_c0_g1_i1.p1  ORF type:complete len:195 (+),score=37.65 TRINITY_DN21019_c0_g1_i1:38-586(+)
MEHDPRVAGQRLKPNVLVTGTPGTGKTSLCSLLASSTGLSCVNIGDLVREKELHSGWDEEYGCHILDEDKLCDELEDRMVEGGNIIDYHSCDFFPERWFDAVVVLQTDNSLLYDRLSNRGYTGKKLSDNIECEIMQVLAEEARENYKAEIIQCMENNTIEDLERNADVITTWVQSWRQAHTP